VGNRLLPIQKTGKKYVKHKYFKVKPAEGKKEGTGGVHERKGEAYQEGLGKRRKDTFKSSNHLKSTERERQKYTESLCTKEESRDITEYEFHCSLPR